MWRSRESAVRFLRVGLRGNHQAVRAVFRVGEQPGAALLRSEDGGVECDGRLTYVVVVDVGEGCEVSLDSRPDLHLCTFRRHPPPRVAGTGYCMIRKIRGRVGNSVRIPVVVSIGCRAPEESPEVPERDQRPKDHPLTSPSQGSTHGNPCRRPSSVRHRRDDRRGTQCSRPWRRDRRPRPGRHVPRRDRAHTAARRRQGSRAVPDHRGGCVRPADPRRVRGGQGGRHPRGAGGPGRRRASGPRTSSSAPTSAWSSPWPAATRAAACRSST